MSWSFSSYTAAGLPIGERWRATTVPAHLLIEMG